MTEADLPALVDKATKVPGWKIEGEELSAARFMQAIKHVDELGKAVV